MPKRYNLFFFELVIGRMGGACTGFDENFVTIFYQASNYLEEIARRAHEETHALHRLGRLELLQEKLDEIGLKIDIMGCSPEAIAEIGSHYALKRQGYSSFKFYLRYILASKLQFLF